MRTLAEIPNSHHLQPTKIHDSMTLMDGLLIADESVQNSTNQDNCIPLCIECEHDLRNNHVPLYVLSNGLWLGTVPIELKSLMVPEQVLIALVYPCCFIFKMHPVTGGGQDPSTLQ